MANDKLKIEYMDGCCSTGIYINDKALTSIEFNELKEIAKKVIDTLDSVWPIQEFLIAVAEEAGEYENLGICEQCGDSVCKYTYIC